MLPTRNMKFCMTAAIGIALSFASLADYDTMPASQKMEFLWQKIVADTHGDAFMNPLKTIIEVMNPANLWAMTKTHDDWRDASHHKCTHGLGAHARAHFVWKQNNYTGMFQQADQCIIRMANAAAPGGVAMTAYGPNLAVKCLRDGAESANMQFIWQVDGYAEIPKGVQKSCSYFETPLSSHSPLRDDIAMPLKDTFIKAFQKVDPNSMFLGVSLMGSGSQNGTAGDIKAPYVPFALVLQPSHGLNKVDCTFNEPVSQLLNLEQSGLGVPGKTLYEVFAVRDPSETWEKPATPEHIGSLVLDSSFTQSTYGDTQLFFRHIFFKEELEALGEHEPERIGAWTDYAKNEENYKNEGANIYWPLLPGGVAEIADIAARAATQPPSPRTEQMLQGDVTLV